MNKTTKKNPEGYPLQGEFDYKDLHIMVENRKGSTRSGEDPDGNKWSIKMKYPYGYISRTKAADNEHVDCYVGDDRDSDKVFVVHQVDPKTGKYDEDKVMLGFKTAKQAKKAYLDHYDSPKFFGSMTEMTYERFKQSLKENKGKRLQKAIETMKDNQLGKMIETFKQDDDNSLEKMKEYVEKACSKSGMKKGDKGYDRMYKSYYKAFKKACGKKHSDNKLKKALSFMDDYLEKGRKMPIGTVSNGRKKVGEGKWVPVKEGKSGKKEEDDKGDKSSKKEEDKSKGKKKESKSDKDQKDTPSSFEEKMESQARQKTLPGKKFEDFKIIEDEDSQGNATVIAVTKEGDYAGVSVSGEASLANKVKVAARLKKELKNYNNGDAGTKEYKKAKDYAEKLPSDSEDEDVKMYVDGINKYIEGGFAEKGSVKDINTVIDASQMLINKFKEDGDYDPKAYKAANSIFNLAKIQRDKLVNKKD